MSPEGFALSIVVLLFSVIVHEVMHGLVALKFGDDTAANAGRLTLNPIPHIDPVGTILLPALLILSGSPILFGWAKPVPVNPLRLNNPKRDMMYVGISGPIANFLVAVFASICLWLIRSFKMFVFVIPIFQYLLAINIILALFNLVPVPPLDGSRIITGLLPDTLSYKYEKLTPFGFLIILFLLSSGLLWSVIGPIINFLVHWLGGGNIFV